MILAHHFKAELVLWMLFVNVSCLSLLCCLVSPLQPDKRNLVTLTFGLPVYVVC